MSQPAFTPEEIREVRSIARMSMREFAKALDVALNTINSWENGKVEISSSLADRVTAFKRDVIRREVASIDAQIRKLEAKKTYLRSLVR